MTMGSAKKKQAQITEAGRFARIHGVKREECPYSSWEQSNKPIQHIRRHIKWWCEGWDSLIAAGGAVLHPE